MAAIHLSFALFKKVRMGAIGIGAHFGLASRIVTKKQHTNEGPELFCHKTYAPSLDCWLNS
ncbi:MAG: hypothetical protein WA758_01830, partial [Candidatus Acidiferrales bacterium]